MRRRDRPLDIFRQMRLIRSTDELCSGDESVGAATTRKSPTEMHAATVAPKKKLNIPVGDVLIDPEYDDMLSSTYTTPAGYVRYNLKIGDEVDLICDYCCDMVDEEWVQAKLSGADKAHFEGHLSVETLEKVINVLERLTGHGDLVTLNNAERALIQALPGMSAIVYGRIMPDIYHYWASKRHKQHKPCCRKYWPQTSVTDTNPHMVFRPREKERYRLRKHRKNDLDSYRKLQQLRREFATAQSLLQLVIEREKLKKADFSVQSEIIEQSIYECQNPDSANPRLPDPSKLFSYNLQYPQLLQPDPVAPVSGRKKDGFKIKMSKGDGEGGVEKERLKPGRKAGTELKRKRASMGDSQGAEASTASSFPATIDLKTDVVIADDANPALFANAILNGNALYEANTARLVTLGIPGPSAFLQPLWPSFMNELPTRDKIFYHSSLAEYADELELHRDQPLPSKFRCRGRIGRGGRMIMDRVPVYDTVGSDPRNLRNMYRDGRNQNTYIYPTSLPSVHEQMRFSQAVRDCKDAKKGFVSSDDVLAAVLVDPVQPAPYMPGKQMHMPGKQGGGGLRSSTAPTTATKNMEFYQACCHPIRDLGLVVPPPRFVQPSELSRREHEIYRMPDSDDEQIDLPEGFVHGPSFTSGGPSPTDNQSKPPNYNMRI